MVLASLATARLGEFYITGPLRVWKAYNWFASTSKNVFYDYWAHLRPFAETTKWLYQKNIFSSSCSFCNFWRMLFKFCMWANLTLKIKKNRAFKITTSVAFKRFPQRCMFGFWTLQKSWLILDFLFNPGFFCIPIWKILNHAHCSESARFLLWDPSLVVESPV